MYQMLWIFITRRKYTSPPPVYFLVNKTSVGIGLTILKFRPKICLFRNQPSTINAGVYAPHHVPLHVDLKHRHHRHDGPHRRGCSCRNQRWTSWVRRPRDYLRGEGFGVSEARTSFRWEESKKAENPHHDLSFSCIRGKCWRNRYTHRHRTKPSS